MFWILTVITGVFHCPVAIWSRRFLPPSRTKPLISIGTIRCERAFGDLEDAAQRPIGAGDMLPIDVHSPGFRFKSCRCGA